MGRVLQHEGLSQSLGIVFDLRTSVGIDSVRYGLIPSALSVANVLEPTIANYHILAIIHD